MLERNTSEKCLVENITYPKSNIFVNAQYDGTLMEDKLFAIAISNPQRIKEWKTDISALSVLIPTKELRLAFGRSDGRFYAELKVAAAAIMNRKICVHRGDSFEIHNLVQSAIFKESGLEIIFNSLLSEYLINLSGGYSLYHLPTIMAFKGKYSLRLYEILRSKIFAGSIPNKKITAKITIEELFFMLGIAKTNLENKGDVKNQIGKTQKLDEIIKNKGDLTGTLMEWKRFHSRCLKPAIEEINNRSDINASYEVLRNKTVYAIMFTVSLKQKEKASETNVNNELLKTIQELFEEKISIADAEKIGKASDYDIEKIKEMYSLAKETGNIVNLVGWMLSAIKHDYQRPQTIKKPNSFNNFVQREYNFDELERKIKE